MLDCVVDDIDVFVLLVYWNQGCELRQDSNGKNGMAMSWTSTKLFSGLAPKSAVNFRYPRTVRLRYSVVPLWKRKKVSAQVLEIDIPGLDQCSAPGAIHAQLQETA
ncbi:hypothetical protein NP493_1302g00047 [Ridgeia piscesae]|uniref:Uncharacterized protein n=1 Tax=Ridgeia piscesae TaxID=27915 RepID=A0AAD9K8B2_RIDPI|nr:hypothetical protein NP493_1302g00047 [Ridgeia piscesae]